MEADASVNSETSTGPTKTCGMEGASSTTSLAKCVHPYSGLMFKSAIQTSNQSTQGLIICGTVSGLSKLDHNQGVNECIVCSRMSGCTICCSELFRGSQQLKATSSDKKTKTKSDPCSSTVPAVWCLQCRRESNLSEMDDSRRKLTPRGISCRVVLSEKQQNPPLFYFNSSNPAVTLLIKYFSADVRRFPFSEI